MLEMAKQAKITLENGAEVILDLFEQDAPNTVANFEKLVNEGYYNGLVFHRVIPGFVAQGGQPLTALVLVVQATQSTVRSTRTSMSVVHSQWHMPAATQAEANSTSVTNHSRILTANILYLVK